MNGFGVWIMKRSSSNNSMTLINSVCQLHQLTLLLATANHALIQVDSARLLQRLAWPSIFYP